MPTYQPSWNSLRRHRTPEWFRDAKFGIYTHWGVYSVPARGPNVTWYPYNMYREGNPQYDYHVKTYGPPEQFGYKDFIPAFTGERFDPEEWAELFQKAGAKFAGPVGEHHDGFTLWDTRLNEWNSVRMGPGRDVVGELERAIRRQRMKYMVALHHAENWWFFPHWRKGCDVADPRYAGLYGELHNTDGPNAAEGFFNQDLPGRAFLEQWRDKILEVIDNYEPDLLWFDFGLDMIAEAYKQDILACYYNKAEEWGREVVVTYKWKCLPPNIAVLDLEQGCEGEMTYHEWITDSTVDNDCAWAYMTDAKYKSATSLVHYLVDNVSKNGHLLLNVGPRPDGTIPEEAKEILLGIGRWLDVNGEAIYGTTPWILSGEGPTKLEKAGPFNEGQLPAYTAQDIRYTTRDNALYATCLGWPDDTVTLTSLKDGCLYPDSVQSVSMLGSDAPLSWQQTPEGLVVQAPPEEPCEHACVFKIILSEPYSA